MDDAHLFHFFQAVVGSGALQTGKLLKCRTGEVVVGFEIVVEQGYELVGCGCNGYTCGWTPLETGLFYGMDELRIRVEVHSAHFDALHPLLTVGMDL